MFFGWRVVAGSFVSLVVVVGFFTYTFTLFVTPLREEFGVGLEQVMYAPTLAPFLALLTSPFFGVMIDRHPVRIIMTVGCLLTAAGFYALSLAASISTFILLYAITFALSNGLSGIMTAGAVVSRGDLREHGRRHVERVLAGVLLCDPLEPRERRVDDPVARAVAADPAEGHAQAAVGVGVGQLAA